jgi:hypothetical protein
MQGFNVDIKPLEEAPRCSRGFKIAFYARKSGIFDINRDMASFKVTPVVAFTLLFFLGGNRIISGCLMSSWAHAPPAQTHFLNNRVHTYAQERSPKSIQVLLPKQKAQVNLDFTSKKIRLSSWLVLSFRSKHSLLWRFPFCRRPRMRRKRSSTRERLPSGSYGYGNRWSDIDHDRGSIAGVP